MHLTCVVLQLCFWPVVFKLFGRLPFWLILKPNYIPSKTNFSKPLKIAQPTMEEYRRHADFWSLHRYPTCGTCLLNLILSSSHKYPPQSSFYLSHVKCLYYMQEHENSTKTAYSCWIITQMLVFHMSCISRIFHKKEMHKNIYWTTQFYCKIYTWKDILHIKRNQIFCIKALISPKS